MIWPGPCCRCRTGHLTPWAKILSLVSLALPKTPAADCLLHFGGEKAWAIVMYKTIPMLLLGGVVFLALQALMAKGHFDAASQPASSVSAGQHDNQYVGADKCKSCHNAAGSGDQYGLWLKSRHHFKPARDKTKATPKNQTDPACLICHGTGSIPAAMKDSAFDDTLGIQCESCHGPGGNHVKARMAAKNDATDNTLVELPAGEIIHEPPMETCTQQCHKGKFDSYKDYIGKLKKIAMLDPRRNHPPEYLNGYSSQAGADGVLFNSKEQTKIRQCPADKAGDYAIPSSVVGIDDKAFFQCTKLASITIPDSVISIGNKAFMGCSGLTSVTIPAGTKSIGDVPFAACPKLQTITVDMLNPAFSSADGVLFDKKQAKLFQCPGAKAGEYTIPGTVTTIEDEAFAGCADLTRITIPASVTSIGNHAFRGCKALTGIYFQGNAPKVSEDKATLDADKATVYYQAGTTGWGSTFGGRPTAVWKP